ncbi:MAG: ATP-binding protein [candidate division KSB1 bacterium]|nr:ATP-binding protein [candidate division KSB1 bacterium]MDZ7365577.1 ATP-binding protein [candidate division KSB1 bacterium]MDZ7403679.1 ATP-binding protein [candidate division KSB1 bacterium]
MVSELILQNPWWDDVHKIHDDRYLQRIATLPFRYQPSVISTQDLAQSGVMTLRGPRQIGKTTYLKALIRDLLERKIPATSIFYYNTELLANERELFEIVRTFAEFASTGKRYIFLDEITLVPRWEYAVKHAVDIGLGEKTLFIVSGSSAVDLRRGGERLPGRRGIVQPDRVLLPLSFRQYCLLQNYDKTEAMTIRAWQESLAGLLPKIKIFFPRLQSYFESYLSHGGFPLAIADYLQARAVLPTTLETYKAVIISDFEKWRKDRITLRDISRRILASLSTPLSWNGLAQDAGGIAANTAKEYVQLLADSYLLYILEFLNKGRKSASPNKNRKLYPFDPLIYQVLAQIATTTFDPSAASQLIEGLVGEALMRNTEIELFEGFSRLTSTFYWRSTREKEVDFVVIWNGEEIPIEVKYQSRISPSDYTTIKRSFGKGLVLTKDAFFQENEIYGLPVACFLYLLP